MPWTRSIATGRTWCCSISCSLGRQGTDAFRSLRERSDVPVIMLTARDTEVDEAVRLELGADAYVTKPFTWHELAERIQAVLHR